MKELFLKRSWKLSEIKNFPLAMPQDIRKDATRATPQVAVHMYKKYYKTKCENKWAVWAKGRPPLFNFA
jgi:hypothetical protein